MRLKKERDTGDFLKKYQTDHSNRRRHRVLPRTQRRRIRARSRDPAPAAPGQPRPVPQRRRQAPAPVQQAQEARDHLRIRRRQGERLKNSQAQSTGPEERHLNPKYPTGSPRARAGGVHASHYLDLHGFWPDFTPRHDAARGCPHPARATFYTVFTKTTSHRPVDRHLC